jgi:protein-glutamine gamma-glutamyltransferase
VTAAALTRATLPRPPPTPPVDVPRLLWTSGIVVVASLPHCLKLAPWIVLLLAAAISWRLTAAARGWRLARRAVRLALAVAAFIAVLAQHGTINGVEAGSALLVVMMALKFLEAQNQRDQLVLIMLAYFLIFATLLTERSPLTVGYLMAAAWLATVGLLQIGRHGPLLAARATVTLAGRLLVQALPIMVLLFLVFPRLPGPLWAIAGSSSATTGLSEELSPGDITRLGLSDDVAFRVEFAGRAPSPRDLYWRGPVLSDFDGRTWRVRPSYRLGRKAVDTIEFSGEPIEYRVMLEPSSNNWAFALDLPQTWSGPRDLAMSSDYQLGVWQGRGVGALDYRATSYTTYAAREPLTVLQREAFSRLPRASSPRTRALAETWLADNPTPEQIVERGMAYLRSQPFRYTLEPPALGAQPVDEFLFETRAGFCEHYASAFAVLMRAAGLPARVVTGYQGGEPNAASRYYIVWQADAHAWTEVWLEERGWVRVDPVAAVAPGRVSLNAWRTAVDDAALAEAFGQRAAFRGITLALDAVYYYWNGWVLGYGPELQRALLDTLGLPSASSERTPMLMLLAVGVVVSASFVLSVYLAWRYRRRPPTDAAARCFAAFCARLARARVPPRGPSEGPVAYAARAARALPQAAGDIEAIAAAYVRARYEPDLGSTALAELRARVARFQPASS